MAWSLYDNSCLATTVGRVLPPLSQWVAFRDSKTLS
ncbi:unnamed protein product [Blumeria hordei]|uniref:Uncharacterized protein n=1 Tax=Blumeria hordei TaxID=2867405 RepID=A0A383UNS7_BLUHO|nr:unnamed protein product [Blumeria hordei]